MSNPIVKVELTGTNAIKVGKSEPVDGWGENGEQVRLTGQLVEVDIYRGNDLHFSVRILEDGSLILTSGQQFETVAESQIRLKATRPWKKKP